MTDTHTNPTQPPVRATRWALRAVLAVASVGLAAGLAGQATWAAYSATTTNPANTFATGTVRISDNDADAAMFDLTGMKAGDTADRCVKVTYTGSVPAMVRLHGTTTGTGLDAYLTLRITRGTYGWTLSPPAFPSCSGFQADGIDYLGLGNGIIYQGTLAGFPDDYAAGLADPTAAAPETWTDGTVHVYRLDVTVHDDTNSQAKSATQTFRWEASSS